MSIQKQATNALYKLYERPQSLAALQKAMDVNIWAVPSKNSPNAEKNQDGALQRMAVVPDKNNLEVKANPHKIGYYKRPEFNSSVSETMHLGAWEMEYDFRNRVARIYQQTMKHVHDTPADKNQGKRWVIDFEIQSQMRSPLMFWTSASEDPMSGCGGLYKIYMENLAEAVAVCKKFGWGYDVVYPHHRWHTRKNYGDNFQWKGLPKEREAYD